VHVDAGRTGVKRGGAMPQPRWHDADRTYERAIPADSFARAVVFAISQPKDVDINEILSRLTSQEF
jgi:NADP-dependent 3-hydroxy acid dehydrogenase YdfG